MNRRKFFAAIAGVLVAPKAKPVPGFTNGGFCIPPDSSVLTRLRPGETIYVHPRGDKIAIYPDETIKAIEAAMARSMKRIFRAP